MEAYHAETVANATAKMAAELEQIRSLLERIAQSLDKMAKASAR